MRPQVEKAGATSLISQTGPASSTDAGDRRRGRGRMIICLLCLLLCLSLGLIACVKVGGTICLIVEGSPDTADCSHFVTPQVIDTKFEFPAFPQASPSPPLVLKLSQDFWLKTGEQLQVSFADYNFLIKKAGVMCDPNHPPANQPHADCAKIWFCDDRKSLRDALGYSITPPYNPVLIAFNGFMAPFTEIQRLDLFSKAGCRSAIDSDVPQTLYNSVFFTPARSATFKLMNYTEHNSYTDPLDKLNKLAEARVFVLATGTGESVTYQLNPLAQSATDAVFYSGTVPNAPPPPDESGTVSPSPTPTPAPGPPVLWDNFSPHLHIGKVRVLKGRPESDMGTGKLHLTNMLPMHPSRLVFIANYQGEEVYSRDTIRCYADATADGDLDLTRCRSNYNNPASYLLSATPTYLAADPTQPLTWVAEFKTGEGGIPPTLADGEILAIEFTVVAD